ncbi:hypothetical protein NFI96_010292 [Prochilodus magdalenae]|nr:hypothetical protein NFI96_010292 [Prochilodus magdalenae]
MPLRRRTEFVAWVLGHLFLGYFYRVPCFDLMDYFNVRDVLGEKAEPGQSSYVRLGTMPIVQQTDVLWAVSYGQRPVGSVLWAVSYGQCPMGSVLWAASCGQCPMGSVLWAVSYGQRPVGSVLWAASCGKCPVVSVLWAASCGQCPVGSVLWAVSYGQCVLWAASCGQCPMGSVLWAVSYGQCPVGSVLWAVSYGQRPMGSVLWAASCGQCPMGSVLWAVSYGQCPVGSVLWAVSCGSLTVHLQGGPAKDVFAQGLPDEYAFVTTFKFRKTSRREDWYLWQVYDKYGIPQVSSQHAVTRTHTDIAPREGGASPPGCRMAAEFSLSGFRREPCKYIVCGTRHMVRPWFFCSPANFKFIFCTEMVFRFYLGSGMW